MTVDLDARLVAYLTTNRDFVAAAVDQAVISLGLRPGARVLDAGTGAGGALPALATAAGEDGTVQAVDRNPAVIALAARHAARAGVADRVTTAAGELAEVLAAAAAAPDRAFDAIWASDVVWPGNFEDPADTVRQMAAALRPGGVAALFYSNYYQATFLPGRSRLERALRTASELRWGLPADGPTHYERLLTWLLAAGLDDVALAIFPRVGFPVDADPTVRPYLESTVWPELLEPAAAHGSDAGLSAGERDQLRHLLTPGDPRYVADEPGYFTVHPTMLATGPSAHLTTSSSASSMRQPTTRPSSCATTRSRSPEASSGRSCWYASAVTSARWRSSTTGARPRGPLPAWSQTVTSLDPAAASRRDE